MIFNMVVGGGSLSSAGLNFSVERCASADVLPVSAKENAIAVISDVEIPEWSFAYTNPFIVTEDVDLLSNITLGEGYLSSSGEVTSQTAANPEVYTEGYIPVEYGKEYTYNYTVSATNSMWLAIVEYTDSYAFKQRLVPVNSVSGTSQTGVYTPSDSTVTAVRLSWRTFPDTECDVEFIETIIVPPEEGVVWFLADTSSIVEFNALKKNGVLIYPSICMQFVSGAWIYLNAYIYQNSSWVQFAEDWDGYYFKDGDQCEDVTGGWTITGAEDAGAIGETLVVESDSASLVSEISTNNMVDLTDVDTIYYYSPNGRGINYYGGYLQIYTETERVSQVNIVAAGQGSIDVSSLSGKYYLKLFTRGGNTGNGVGYCDISKIWKG